MANKVAIITGGSHGIGLNATEKLLKSGVHCIIASRNIDNVNSAVAKLKASTKREHIEGMQLDLTDPESVRSFVNQFKNRNIPLNILVNNAGVQPTTKTVSKSGIEMTFSANHLGHFLLTNLLLEKLKESAPSRIVIVASEVHDQSFGPMARDEHSIDDYNFDKEEYDTWAAYRFSKLCNILHMHELHRRLEGSNVTVNAICPGFIPGTGLFRDHNSFFRLFTTIVSKLGGRSMSQGADCIVDVAIGETGNQSGRFIASKSPGSARSRDAQEQAKLWALSETLVG